MVGHVAAADRVLHAYVGLIQSIELSDYLLANLEGLLLGGIKTKFCEQILVGKLVTRSIML